MSKGDLTRQRIIELAAPLFNQRGFEGCSMQDILDATGLKKGGIYRHFRSKEELAAESFRHTLARAFETRLPDLDSRLDAIEALQTLVQLFVELPSPIPGGCPILNTAIDADDGNEVLRHLARDGLVSWRNKVSDFVRAGISRKQIRADVDPRAVANTIIAMLEGALMISRLEKSRTALKDAKRALEVMINRLSTSSDC